MLSSYLLKGVIQKEENKGRKRMKIYRFLTLWVGDQRKMTKKVYRLDLEMQWFLLLGNDELRKMLAIGMKARSPWWVRVMQVWELFKKKKIRQFQVPPHDVKFILKNDGIIGPHE